MPPVGRQAGHEQRVRLRQPHKFHVDLVGREDCFAQRGLFFLAHAGPHIRIHGVRILETVGGVMGDHKGAFGFFGCPARNFRVPFVAFRADQRQIERHARGEVRPRVENVVAVAHKAKLQALERTLVLAYGHQVRQHLAGVRIIR